MTAALRLLTVVGDPNDINTWSNIPYYFLKAGREAGFLHQGIPLNPDTLRSQRLLWNAKQLLLTGKYGGFQYTSSFTQPLFSQVRLESHPTEIISHFPLLPPHPWQSNWRVSYYLDATTKQVFDDYGMSSRIGPTIQTQALAQERINYTQAERIICMSPWAAQSVIHDYSISPRKVYVVPGGANLSEEELPDVTFNSKSFSGLKPLRLGFVGKDWHRKGLPFLLQVADELTLRGVEVIVLVAGPSLQDLPRHPLIQSLGFIDKASALQKYVQLVQSFHFGCLFSRAEAFGISNIECLRLGIPVLASNVGGIPATVPESLGYLFEPNVSPKSVADLLESFVQNPSAYCELRQRIAREAKSFSWQTTVNKIVDIWGEDLSGHYPSISP